MAAELGTLRLGRVSLDGTKMQGRQREQAQSDEPGGMRTSWSSSWQERCRRCMKLAQQAQEAEAEQQERWTSRKSCSAGEERLAAIRDAKEKIEELAQERHAVERAEYEEKMKRRQEREAATGKQMGGRPPKEPEAGPKDKDQVNFTDEESRIMPGAKGDFIQRIYNAQAVVEQDSHIVVATHVSQAANDKQEMEQALKAGGIIRAGRILPRGSRSGGGNAGYTASPVRGGDCFEIRTCQCITTHATPQAERASRAELVPQRQPGATDAASLACTASFPTDP